MCKIKYRYVIVYTITNGDGNKFKEIVSKKYNVKDKDIDQSTIGVISTVDSIQDLRRFLEETKEDLGINGTIRFFCTGHLANTQECDEIFQYNI